MIQTLVVGVIHGLLDRLDRALEISSRVVVVAEDIASASDDDFAGADRPAVDTILGDIGADLLFTIRTHTFDDLALVLAEHALGRLESCRHCSRPVQGHLVGSDDRGDGQAGSGGARNIERPYHLELLPRVERVLLFDRRLMDDLCSLERGLTSQNRGRNRPSDADARQD